MALSNLSNSSLQMSKKGVQTACEQAVHLIETAQEIDISPFVLSAMIWYESRWIPDVTPSPKGACGLTQILPKYSPYSCRELENPRRSITEGASILYYWYEREGSIKSALKCYNSGYKCSSTQYANTILKKTKLLQAEYLKVQQTLIGDSNE